MKHLVLGIGGALGNEVVNVLLEQHKQVVGVSRLPMRVDIETRRVDLNDADATLRALQDAGVLYYCVGVAEASASENKAMLAHVIAAAKKAKAKLVYMDCIEYYGKIDFTQPIDENRAYDTAVPQARIRQALVELVKQSEIPYLIVRSPLLYGPRNVKSCLYPALLAPILAGRKGQFVGKRYTRYPYAYVEDVARALVLLAGIDSLYGQIWHAPVDASVSLSTISQLLQEHLQRPVKIQTTPFLVSRVLGTLLPLLKQAHAQRDQFDADCVWDDSKFRRQFPMFETTPFAQGMIAMVESFTPKR